MARAPQPLGHPGHLIRTVVATGESARVQRTGAE